MRKAITTALIVSTAVALGAQTARTPLPAPGTNKALVVKASEVQDLIKAYPGGNAEIKSIDAGRPRRRFLAGAAKAGPGDRPDRDRARRNHRDLLHRVGHGDVDDLGTPGAGRLQRAAAGHAVSRRRQVPDADLGLGKYEGGETHKVGPGDVIVVPPGTSHQWTAIDTPDFAYFIARIDPDKRQAAGLVNSALKQ